MTGKASFVASARKLWPRALWIVGNGKHASPSACPPGCTVMLFGTGAEAEAAKREIELRLLERGLTRNPRWPL
jgi:hypothetical protein